MISISMWMDPDSSSLYVKLNDRISNNEFREGFLEPLKVLGFKFDPSKVAHGLKLKDVKELGLLLRQLESNFTISGLEKNEILYALGMQER